MTVRVLPLCKTTVDTQSKGMSSTPTSYVSFLEIQQHNLLVHAACISRVSSTGHRDSPVAWHDDGKRILPASRAHRTGCPWMPHPCSYVTISPHCAVGNLHQLAPDISGETITSNAQRQLKPLEPPREIGIQLPGRLADDRTVRQRPTKIPNETVGIGNRQQRSLISNQAQIADKRWVNVSITHDLGFFARTHRAVGTT